MTGRTETSEPTGLERQLGPASATALVISSMIGTGIFTTTGFLAGDLGAPGIVLWSWVAGAACALLGALCYSELAVNMPESGGEYVYLRTAWGPVWGFMSGWVSFFAGFAAPIAVAALAFASYLSHVCAACGGAAPLIALGTHGLRMEIGMTQLIAAALVVFLTVLNVIGVRHSARFQNLFTTFKIAVLAAFIALAFLAGHGNWSNFTTPAVRTSSSPLPEQFAVSLFYIYLSYSGWNAATYVAGEVRAPGRTLPRALIWGTAAVTLFYLTLNVVYIYAAPLETLKGQIAVGAVAANALFGNGVGLAFSGLMALSLIASVNAQVMTGPRVSFAMAHHGAFFSAAGKVHPRWRTPWIAILAQGLCTLVMTVTPLADLMQYVGFTLSLFTALGVASLFRLRRREGWRRLPAISFAWPLIPVLFLIPEIWIVIWGIQIKPLVSLAGIATVATGALAFETARRLRPSAL